MKIDNEIATMRFNNLTDKQVRVILELARFAEDGFDQSSLRAESVNMRDKRTKQANRCMVLRNRLWREIKNRKQQEQNK